MRTKWKTHMATADGIGQVCNYQHHLADLTSAVSEVTCERCLVKLRAAGRAIRPAAPAAASGGPQ